MGIINIDLETANGDGTLQLRIIPETTEQHYYLRDAEKSISFECPFDHSDKNVRRFIDYMRLPERKFVHWRGKKMLVRKVSEQLARGSFSFDLPYLKRELGL